MKRLYKDLNCLLFNGNINKYKVFTLLIVLTHSAENKRKLSSS